MRRPVRIVFSKDVPYLAGYSKNGRVIYVDRHVRRFWHYHNRTIDVAKFLILHEKVEKILIDLFDLRYQAAHHIATWWAEFTAVELAGIKWHDYDKYLSPQIKTEWHEKLTNLPLDLDTTPYSDEGDKVLEKRMNKQDKKEKKSKIKNR